MSASTNLDQIQQLLDRGLKLRMANDLHGAIVAYNAVLALDPQNAEALNNRGNIYASQKNRDSAIADYTKAIEINPAYAVAYYNRGLEKQLDGYIDEALADYEQALSLATDAYLRAGIYLNLGIIAETRGQHQVALRYFEQAIQLDPLHISAYFNRGFAHERNGEYIEAIADYEQVLKLDPNYKQSHYMRGMIALVKGLQSELRKRLSGYVSDAEQASTELWPLLARAMQGVQFDIEINDPLILLDQPTVETLVDDMLNINITEGQQNRNGN